MVTDFWKMTYKNLINDFIFYADYGYNVSYFINTENSFDHPIQKAKL